MARKAKKRASTAGGKAKRTRSSPRDPRTRILAAALRLAAEDGWGHVGMADITEAAGLDLDDVRAVFASKSAIVAAFFGDIDEAVLASGDPDAGESARDRLFDILMRRFDALEAHKKAVASILGDLASRPAAALGAAPRFMCSMARMVEAAGLSARGPCGIARTKGLALVYANAVRVWLGDDSADMAVTMAALDKGLRQAEKAVNLCRRMAPTAAA